MYKNQSYRKEFINTFYQSSKIIMKKFMIGEKAYLENLNKIYNISSSSFSEKHLI